MRRSLFCVALATVSLGACSLRPSQGPSPSPTLGPKWIEVILSQQVANLWIGDELVLSLPVSTGIADSPSTTTFAGTFEVATMYRGPEETAPGVFVQDIVIFDWEHGNGFHSLPMDARGRILDETLGKPASAGCIRVRDSGILYEFAEVDMKVVIR